MAAQALFSWIGKTDLRASCGDPEVGLGPIAQAIKFRPYSHIILISNYPEDEVSIFISWLGIHTSAKIFLYHKRLSTPTDFTEIYEAAVSVISDFKRLFKDEDIHYSFHLSPGTPAMAAIWILLSKTSYPSELIETSREHGLKTVYLPFDISADYIPDIIKPEDDKILMLTQGLPPESPEYSAIIHRCKAMKRVIAQARRLAIHDVPVLIQGESGTGKELFARAIHTSSPRKDNPFIPVNCGSIPPELIESEFFGHKKGAFTGAVKDKTGYFTAADKGTLFLDEIGELPLPAQVKLLRAIQEGMIIPLGDTRMYPIKVRIIAATNRNLIKEIAEGRFREDLFHRIAVGVLNLPPLRDRHGDLNPVIDHIMEGINLKFKEVSGWKHKKLSAGARNLMHHHAWLGNIRELYNTLSRAAIWTSNEIIDTDDMREAMLTFGNFEKDEKNILNRSLGNDFSLKDLIIEVARHYLDRAVVEGKGNKTKIASLLGLPNYQTVSNWMKKYGIEE